MATRRFKVSIGETEQNVVNEVGAAVNSDTVELTVDVDANIPTTSGNRKPTRDEVLTALKQIENHILSINWPLT